MEVRVPSTGRILVFSSARVAIFCDGDFWHGRNLAARRAKLAQGHNAEYWVAKIEGNVRRDRLHDQVLAAGQWLVLRYWESDILSDPGRIADEICEVLRKRRRGAAKSGPST